MMPSKTQPTERPIAIDLFCGAGGMALGFEQAGFDVKLAVDVDGHHVATHSRNFPQATTLCKSVSDLTLEDVRQAVGEDREVDLIFGGPPCQGFSHMGLRDTKDPRNSLIDQFVRVVAEVRPRSFVMENVPGMLAGETKRILDRALEQFERAGYRIVHPVKILDASDFGVPQKRRRLFVIGVRADQPGMAKYPDSPARGQPNRPTVLEAISDLPTIERYESLLSEDVVEFDSEPNADYAKVARGAKRDASDFSHRRLWASTTCSGCLRIRHSPRSVELYSTTPPGETVPGHKLPRLSPTGICPTLRAGSDSTHGSYTAPRPIHPTLPRCITAREAARLHGYPDWFWFYPSKWHAYRQIGNSVCPPVARAVGREVMEAIGAKAIRPSKAIRLTETFLLPDDRPRTLKRIPQIRHYTPVIAHIFEGSFDARKKRLWRTRFTFEDVAEAIARTGASLAHSRPDTFVQEIGRSRNVNKILAPCLDYGYTIRPLAEGDFIGEFVEVGAPGAINDKDEVQVKSQDLSTAVPLPEFSPIELTRPASLFELAKTKFVRELLWGKSTVGIDFLLPYSRERGGLDGYFIERRSKGKDVRGCAVALEFGSIPLKSRIARLAQTRGVEQIVVLVPITTQHVLMTRFDDCRDSPREVTRAVFQVSNELAASAPSGKRNGKSKAKQV